MTYNDAVNDLVRRYCNGEFKGWILTDDDTAQLRRDLDGRCYEFVELTENWNGWACLHHAVIDLNDYTAEQLWQYGSAYYEDEAEFFSRGEAIGAECVYEQSYTLEKYESPEQMMEAYLKIVKEEHA